MARLLLVGIAGLAALLLVLVYLAGAGRFGSHEGPGVVTRTVRPAERVAAEERAVADAARGVGLPGAKSILFGDLHVHTTFSFDAFSFSLPAAGGEGAHPPADACDFARFCSALDFWSINDHAFSLTPQHWEETVESIEQCNDVAAGEASPDTVAFLGWEWTNVGLTPDEHYGHKNVILRNVSGEGVPPRPIAALRGAFAGPGLWRRALMALAGDARVRDLGRYFAEWDAADACDESLASSELPIDCIEQARTPADLFRRLDEWEAEALVIPHGTTWGFYTPPGSTWDKQLEGALHSEAYQSLLEVYSGHGDSEVYRAFRGVTFDEAGNPRCPAPTPGYEPSCWRAGEIIRGRCLADGESSDECDLRAEDARANAARAGVAVHRTVPGATAADFLDAGQCRDCREPSFNYRPGGSAQYILALGGFAGGGEPRRFRMGFMASSDNHFARPGTGYKEYSRRGNTESQGGPLPDDAVAIGFAAPGVAPSSRSVAFRPERPGFDIFETERQASFLTTGGLIAAHSVGRDRDAIWDAMQRREVYGTTGPRILLWFDLLNPPGSRGKKAPMGSEVEMGGEPIFQARAVGSFEQQPGCPSYSLESLEPERLQHLCKGECYNPGDARRPITRIEVVRIRPQRSPDEDIGELIDDPWRTFACSGDEEGCVVTFSDPDYARDGRETLYYARAFESTALAINAGNLRCTRDEAGNCLETRPCPGPDGARDDCLAPHEPRAWSSPIWIDPPR
jgi:hypothetical protein